MISDDKKLGSAQIAGLGLMSAIVVVLQLLGSFFRLGPFSVSLVLVPIVVGASMYGVFGGTWLGFIFGMTVLFSGDASLFLAVNVPGTVITVLLKGMLAGFVTAVIYKALSDKNKMMAVAVSAFACPIVNTGIFLLGCAVFFMDTINGWASAAGFANAGKYMIIGLVGGNFIFELLVNVVLSPVAARLIAIVKGKIR